MRLFSPDSKIMLALGHLCDLVILNVVYLFTCLPVFTIGAATAALYTACFPMGTETEGALLRTYFRGFRENFRQGTAVFCLLLPGELLCAGAVWLFYPQAGMTRYACAPFAVVLAVLVFLGCYVYPLLSRFQNTVKQTMKNALLLSIGYLPRTVCMAVLNLLPLGVLLFDPVLFAELGLLWLLFYFAAAAFLSTLLLRRVLKPYMT